MPRHGASRGLQLFPEQPVAVAVPVQPPPAPGTEPGAGLALGVELHQVEPAGGHIGQEGDIIVISLCGQGISCPSFLCLVDGVAFYHLILGRKKAGDLFQISCSVCRCVSGGYLVVKVRDKLTRCKANKLKFDLPIFLKSHVELLFHLPRYALLILTSISIFY